MYSLSDLVQALKMAEELSFWAGLPLYGIGYGVAIWVLSWGLGKLREVLASWIESIKGWRQERDAALARIGVLAGDVGRVRKQAADARRRLSAARAGACKLEREQLARCAGLVERGAELVRRGVELSERTAIDKDAVVKIVSQ